MEPGVYSWVQESNLEWEPEDTPSGLVRVEFRKQNGKGTALTYELAYTDGATNLRRYWGESGPDYTIRWARSATATPPQVHNLPLLDGYSLGVDGAGYSKTQEGIVCVYFSVYGNFEASASDIGGDAFATLPEGFRPTGKIPVPVVQQDIPGPDWVKVIVHPDGSMRYYGNGSTTAIYGSVSFVAS